jgi:ribosome-associated heat shock protein Hsp15
MTLDRIHGRCGILRSGGRREQDERNGRGEKTAHDSFPLEMTSVRLDKWLWAARFFKTRSMATDAVAGGKVEVNGESAKPAKAIKVGDTIRVRLAPFDHVLVVRDLAERRGPASVAQALYEETGDSKAARAKLSEQLRLGNTGLVYEDKGRPTKKDRRDLDRFSDKHRR